ncbi:MAG: CheR family methyltransferase [Kofleriaceae bacterium]
MTAPLRVVAIGASAGGLDALRRLLTHLPLDTGLGFLVLQHHSPAYPGAQGTALTATTELPIVELTEATTVLPDHVYLLPPSVTLAAVDGALVVTPHESEERVRMPIDALMCSLAELVGTRAIGIVLSGTANDGTEGLRALRTIGGVTIAQEPATAQFDEMPRSAIAAGGVGIVLAPELIGPELGRLRRAAAEPAPERTAIEQIIELLRDAIGVDFSSYKRATVERRITRRIGELGLAVERYPDYLRSHTGEAAVLYEDLLIHVTEFFRDHATLDELATRVFPELVERTPPGGTIRVWIPGCSTGQEAYSIAILLLEFLESASHRPRIQIFGTDLSERAIETARLGEYPDAIANQVSTQRRERFFTRTENGWRIAKDLRERCIFVRHDLTVDPPFSKLDLISCRNVLIYLGPSLQQGVIPMFHYALKQPGYLLLGPAEGVNAFEGLFAPLASGLQIFARRAAPATAALGPSIGRGRSPYRDRPPYERRRTLVDVQHSVDHLLLARYAPACVVIDEDAEIIQFRGRTGAFVEPPLGEPHYNLIRMLRDGLGSDVRAALQQAHRTDLAVRRENIILREEGKTRRISIEVVPLSRSSPDTRHYVVVFEEANEAQRRAKQMRRITSQHERSELMALREELVATKEYLHTALVDNASTIEEIGAANEELHSMNEELMSTNEELQTTKEELQASNEELETVNAQLRHGHDELQVLNDDLVNVLASVDIAIVIVDSGRMVRRFTPRARTLLNLRPADIGREITELQPNVGVSNLGDAIDQVIESLVTLEREVPDPAGHCYRMQIRPYRSVEDKISGAVISFVDITALRHNLDEAKLTRDRAAAIVETVPSPLVVVDPTLGVQLANRAFQLAFGSWRPGQSLFEIGNATWDAAQLRDAIAGGAPFDDLQLELVTSSTERRVFVAGARVLEIGPPASMLIGLLDITERVRLEETRGKLAKIEADTMVEAAREKDAFLDAVSHELRTPLNAILLWTELLRTKLDPARYRRAIDTIEWSARAQVQLVDDLLDLSLSRDPDQLALHVEGLDPVPIVEAALDTVRADAHAKRIDIATELDGALRLRADPRRLQQIVWHVAANAVKFTPEGGALRVSLARRDGHAEISVSDTGIGIREEDLPFVFQPFRRDRSTAREAAGLGIGLALVRHLVERQGGTITARSPGEGNGSTFTVQLPLDS